MTTVSGATVRRSPYIEAAETGGITVEAADLGLLGTLSGKVARGRFLDAASERYPSSCSVRSRHSASASIG